MKIYANNKKANFEYFLLKSFTAGLVLTGIEVKSIINGEISLKESFIKIIKGEAFLLNANIARYKNTPSYYSHDEVRPRKLLLTKRELIKLEKESKESSISIIPLKIFKEEGKSKIKLEIYLAKGKKLYDKRETLKKKDINLKQERLSSY